MIGLLVCLAAMLPLALYFWREHRLSTPSLQWPQLGKVLGLQYAPKPPRMSGAWGGRRVAAEAGPEGVTLTAWLNVPTSLRVECAPTTVMSTRAWLVIPDPVEPFDPAFRERMLARCSVKAAGPVVFDPTLQRRIAALPHVDFVGQDTRVVWKLPALRDPDGAEAVLGVLCAIADGLENFPKDGGAPHA